MKKAKKRIWISAIIVAVLALTACGSKTESTDLEETNTSHLRSSGLYQKKN